MVLSLVAQVVTGNDISFYLNSVFETAKAVVVAALISEGGSAPVLHAGHHAKHLGGKEFTLSHLAYSSFSTL